MDPRRLLVGALLAVVSTGCGDSALLPTYVVPSPSSEYRAVIGQRALRYYVQVQRGDAVLLDENLGIDAMEAGIAAVAWKPDGSAFAVKLYGYDTWVGARVYGVPGGEAEVFDQREAWPQWTGFDKAFGASDALAPFRPGP